VATPEPTPDGDVGPRRPIGRVRHAEVATVVGVVRSCRTRPWAGDADVVCVVADGTGDVTVALRGIGPMSLTAGTWVAVRGFFTVGSDRVVRVDNPVLRAVSASDAVTASLTP
jgi:hypothetical protein